MSKEGDKESLPFDFGCRFTSNFHLEEGLASHLGFLIFQLTHAFRNSQFIQSCEKEKVNGSHGICKAHQGMT